MFISVGGLTHLPRYWQARLKKSHINTPACLPGWMHTSPIKENESGLSYSDLFVDFLEAK